MRAALLIVLTGCATTTPMRGDWCGTDRAELHYLGERSERCNTGDVFACVDTRRACAKRGISCEGFAPLATDALVDECIALESKEGELCSAPEEATALPRLRALYQEGCDRVDAESCFHLGLVREHANEDPDVAYERACERSVGGACARLGDRTRARGEQMRAVDLYFQACDHGATRGCSATDAIASELEVAARYDDAVRVLRTGCFKWSRTGSCVALEDFRALAKRVHNTAMIRAASQGPADDALANYLDRIVTSSK